MIKSIDKNIPRKSEMSRKALIKGNRNFSPCDVCDVYGTLIGKTHAEAWEENYKK